MVAIWLSSATILSTPLGAWGARYAGIYRLYGAAGYRPAESGETLVVAAATGPVGATVGQIGKLKGCRTVGIAGGVEKCRYAVEVLGFDACLDHRAADFSQQLAQACPQGIDVYYENVGGKVFDAVLPLLNTAARVPVCGLVSGYNATALPDGGSAAAADGDDP